MGACTLNPGYLTSKKALSLETRCALPPSPKTEGQVSLSKRWQISFPRSVCISTAAGHGRTDIPLGGTNVASGARSGTAGATACFLREPGEAALERFALAGGGCAAIDECVTAAAAVAAAAA